MNLNRMNDDDVVVIGSGAAGLFEALVLSLARRTVLVVDAAQPLVDVTDVTQGSGLIALAPGGLSELVLPHGRLTRGFRLVGTPAPSSESPQLVNLA